VAPVIGELHVDLRRKSFVAPGSPPRTTLEDIAFGAAPGEFVAVDGPSGCGKTTLLNIVAGLDHDFTGVVTLGGGPPTQHRLGYVFQEPRLLPWRTVYDNLALVLPRPAPRARIEAMLAEVGLAAARDVHPSRLSLGMARRVAIARAFLIEPELLLMDEPFQSLDAAAARRMQQLLLGLWRARPTTVLLVTHDLSEAVLLADRILLLSDTPGRLLADIPVPLSREERYDNRAAERVRAEIAAVQHRLLSGGAVLTSASRDRR
jgi:NitT/TauT family transport system ATP-binding protein